MMGKMPHPPSFGAYWRPVPKGLNCWFNHVQNHYFVLGGGFGVRGMVEMSKNDEIFKVENDQSFAFFDFEPKQFFFGGSDPIGFARVEWDEYPCHLCSFQPFLSCWRFGRLGDPVVAGWTE